MISMRTFINWLVVLALAATAIGMYVWANVDDYATRLVNDQLTTTLENSGLSASVRQANFISGVGVELRDLELADFFGRQRGKLCTIRSVLIRFPAQFEKLVTANIAPTAIDIDGVKLFVDLEQLDQEFFRRVSAIQHKLPESKDPVPVRIRNSSLLMRSSRLPTDLTFRNVNIDLVPNDPANIASKPKFEFQLQAEGNLVDRLQVTGLLDLEQQIWSAELQRALIPLNGELVRALPLPGSVDRSWLDGLMGQAALRGRAAGKIGDPQTRYLFRGRAIDVSIDNQRLPGNVRDAAIDFQLSDRGLQIDRLTGNFKDGRFDLRYEQRGLTRPEHWATSGSIRNFNLDAAARALVPEEFQKVVRDFSPAGYFDLQFDLDSNGKKKITSQITDMSFSFYKFPYPVDHCVGSVNWAGNLMDFEIQGVENGQLLTLSGRINNPGKRATYRCEFGTEGRLPIDEKLMNSLQKYPSMQNAVRNFRPAGFVSGHGSVEKVIPGASTVKRDIRIQMHDCRVRHRNFDYPMQEVAGRVHITNDGFSFEDVTGRSSSGRATCNGSWNPRSGLRLVFNCGATELDQHLRHALTPSLQELWDGFRPRGRIESGRVDLELPPGSPYADIRVSAMFGNQNSNSPSSGVTIFPTWFPYRIHNLNGRVEVGGGVIRAENIVGKHGNTTIGFNGLGRYSDIDWSMQLTDMLAVQLPVDEELLFALPVDLSNAMRELEFDGFLNVNGSMDFAGRNDSTSTAIHPVQQVSYESTNETYSDWIDIGWDVRLDMDQSKILLGLPIENIFGSVKLEGTCKNEICECSGQVAVDSLTVQGLQVTSVQGPIWIDNNQTLAGKFARSDESESASLVGDAFNGKVSFDGWVSHEGKYPFRVKTVVEKSQLDDLAFELAPELRELSGDGYVLVELTGNANEPHTYTGQGNVHLRNAKIHQLPIVLSLLKILSIKEVNRTAFDSSNIDFSVKGNQVRLDRIELIGDAISLIGNGYLELMRHADVNFYSVVGRNRFNIPLISDIYRAGSQRIMWINISGPFQNLQTTRKILPGLDDSLRTLIRAGDVENNASRSGQGASRR